MRLGIEILVNEISRRISMLPRECTSLQLNWKDMPGLESQWHSIFDKTQVFKLSRCDSNYKYSFGIVNICSRIENIGVELWITFFELKKHAWNCKLGSLCGYQERQIENRCHWIEHKSPCFRNVELGIDNHGHRIENRLLLFSETRAGVVAIMVCFWFQGWSGFQSSAQCDYQRNEKTQCLLDTARVWCPR